MPCRPIRWRMDYCDPSRELNFWRPTPSALLELGLHIEPVLELFERRNVGVELLGDSI